MEILVADFAQSSKRFCHFFLFTKEDWALGYNCTQF